MFQNDFLGVAIVHIYVAVIFIVSEKFVSKRYPIVGRKFLHIMVGNFAFLLPLFQSREIMTFIFITFLMSPYSPIKSIRCKTSKAGHGLGLVYYAIAWTVLALFFFDHKEVIAIGILAMSYGDGLASLFGIKYGTKKYRVLKEVKSYVGTASMLVVTFLLMIIAHIFYQISLDFEKVWLLFCISIISSFVEGITPFGLDNLSIAFITALLYWRTFII